MGDLIVVSGPPGAGKSSVAARLASLLDLSALVPGDSFFGFLRQGAIAPWLPHAHTQNSAVTEAAAAAAGRLSRYCDVVYDGVLGPWFLDRFLERTGIGHLQYVVLLPPLEVCLDRVRDRTGHGFTDLDAAAHMWREFQQAAPERRHLIHSTAAPDEVARDVAHRMAAGLVRYPGRRVGLGS